MLRRLYATLLRLHPRAFRDRFSEEMLSIFEESPQKVSLLLDACVSLVRQWTLRPGATDHSAQASAPAPDGIPVFHTIDLSLPRTSALLPGAFVSFGFFAAVGFAMNHGGAGSVLLIGAQQPIPRPLSVARSSIAPADATTRVRVADRLHDPWLEFAEGYFRIMPVLRALDADHDLLISRAEIAHASAALASLDLNLDGKLSAQECGAAGPREMYLEFMRAQPVLAALDADHDGEISAAEIARAPAALRKLDISGDGVLAPVEIAPESVVKRILQR